MYSRYFAALTKARDEVMHLVGLPTKKNFASFLDTVLVTSDYKFKFYSRQGTADGDRAARYWADIGVKAGERFEKYGARDATSFADVVQTEFEYVNEEIPMAEADLIATIKVPAALEDRTQEAPAPALVQREEEV